MTKNNLLNKRKQKVKNSKLSGTTQVLKVVVKKPTKAGIVSSTKMQKTVVVKVETKKPHPKYKKIIKKVKKFKAHNRLENIKVGDKVIIESTRPISKGVSWQIVEKLK